MAGDVCFSSVTATTVATWWMLAACVETLVAPKAAWALALPFQQARVKGHDSELSVKPGVSLGHLLELSPA